MAKGSAARRASVAPPASSAGWSTQTGAAVGLPMPEVLRNTLFPLLLMAVTFPLAFTLVHSSEAVDIAPGAPRVLGVRAGAVAGSAAALVARVIDSRGGYVLEALGATLPAGGSDDMWAVLRLLGTFCAFQLAVMRLMPGRQHRGPVSPSGHVPVYTANGFQSFAAALSAYVLAVHVFHAFSAAEVLRLYPKALATMSIASLAFCLVLYFKGLYFPSGPDHGTVHNPVIDFYWGTELYPRILGWDVKVFTNCRFGMMSWALLPIVFLGATAELSGGRWTYAQAVNCVLRE